MEPRPAQLKYGARNVWQFADALPADRLTIRATVPTKPERSVDSGRKALAILFESVCIMTPCTGGGGLATGGSQECCVQARPT